MVLLKSPTTPLEIRFKDLHFSVLEFTMVTTVTLLFNPTQWQMVPSLPRLLFYVTLY